MTQTRTSHCRLSAVHSPRKRVKQYKNMIINQMTSQKTQMNQAVIKGNSSMNILTSPLIKTTKAMMMEATTMKVVKNRIMTIPIWMTTLLSAPKNGIGMDGKS